MILCTVTSRSSNVVFQINKQKYSYSSDIRLLKSSDVKWLAFIVKPLVIITFWPKKKNICSPFYKACKSSQLNQMTNLDISQATQFTADDGFKKHLLPPLNINFFKQWPDFTQTSFNFTLDTAQVLMKVCEKQKQAPVLQELSSEPWDTNTCTSLGHFLLAVSNTKCAACLGSISRKQTRSPSVRRVWCPNAV